MCAGWDRCTSQHAESVNHQSVREICTVQTEERGKDSLHVWNALLLHSYIVFMNPESRQEQPEVDSPPTLWWGSIKIRRKSHRDAGCVHIKFKSDGNEGTYVCNLQGKLPECLFLKEERACCSRDAHACVIWKDITNKAQTSGPWQMESNIDATCKRVLGFDRAAVWWRNMEDNFICQETVPHIS